MNMQRCDTCNGRKRTLGMGGIIKECKPCNGIGWIKLDAPKAVTMEKATEKLEQIVPIKKKSGKKSKNAQIHF